MSTEAIKANFDARQHAVQELRSLDAAAMGREFTAEERQTEERLNGAITEYDARIAKGLGDAERHATQVEQEARFAALAPSAPAVEERNTADQDRLGAFLRGEVRSIEFAPESRALGKGTASAGGYSVPTSFYAQLVEHMIDTSAIMANGAQVMNTTSGEDIQVPKTSSYSAASIVSEAGTIGASDPVLSQVTMKAYKYAFLTSVSSELIQDSAVDLLGFLARQGGVALGNGMGAHFISGTGSGQPNGAKNATVGKTTALATAITADEVIDTFHSLAAVYRNNAAWVFNDSVIAYIRKLKDSTNQYLWQPGLVAGAPDTLLGKPVLTDPAMDSAVTTGKVTGLFGDLSGYFVRQAGPVRIERSDEFAFNTDQITFRLIARADGNIVDANALRTLKQA